MANLTVTATQVRPLVPSTTVSGTAAVDMSVGNLVYNTASGWDLADATLSATNDGQLGIVVAGSNFNGADPAGAILAGQSITVLIWGRIYLGNGVTLDDDTIYYTSTTPGAIADATSTHARKVGHMLTSTILMFNPAVDVAA